MKAIAVAAVLALATLVSPAIAGDYDQPEIYTEFDEAYKSRFNEPVIIDAIDQGYWVIVGSIDVDDVNGQAAGHRVADRVAHCGVRTFNDFSHKFHGFREGYMVYVAGVYATQGEANRARAAVSKCVPDAYVKYGEYYGN